MNTGTDRTYENIVGSPATIYAVRTTRLPVIWAVSSPLRPEKADDVRGSGDHIPKRTAAPGSPDQLPATPRPTIFFGSTISSKRFSSM
jgi:hypothetical protein